MQTIWLLFFR